MAGEQKYMMSDLYPNFSGVNTSVLANPEPDDQDAMGEDITVAEESTSLTASKRNVFIALFVLIALIVFLGGK